MVTLALVALNLTALSLGAGVLWVTGIPDAQTLSGAASLALVVAPAVSLLLLPLRAVRKRNASTLRALKAIDEARRKNDLAILRADSWEVLLAATGAKHDLSADLVVRAARQLLEQGEYKQLLKEISGVPLAHEVMRLAGQTFADRTDESRIALEGYLAFIGPHEPVDAWEQAMAMRGGGLTPLIEKTRFEPIEPEQAIIQEITEPEYAEPEVDVAVYVPEDDYSTAEELPEPVGEAAPARAHVDYQNIVDAALQIFTIEQITELPLARRQVLFNRIRTNMESAGGRLARHELDEIAAWFSAT